MHLDILVNGLTLAIILLGVIFSITKLNRRNYKKNGLLAKKLILSIIWIGFILSIVSTVVFYQDIKNAHDIDDATEGAVSNFLKGVNPYKENVVPRFSEKYHGDNTPMVNSTYNYLPLSLLFYSIPYYIFHEYLGTLWYPMVNLILGFAVFLMASYTFPAISKKIFLPIIGMISLFFIFDNVMLALLFLSIAFYYLIKSREKYRYFFVLLFLFLTVSVKFTGLIILSVFLLYLIQKYRFRNGNINAQIALFIILSSLLTIILIFPFGLHNVLYSTIFYFSSISIRSQSSVYGGTLLTCICNSQCFSFASTLLIIILVASSIFIKPLYARLFFPESLLPFFTIQASHALLMVPIYSLMVMVILKIFPEFELSEESFKL